MDHAQRCRISVLRTAIFGLVCTAVPAWGQLEQAGEHIPIKIDTPRDYPGARGTAARLEWRYELSHPGATYIAVHFVNFDLGPRDYLIVSDPDGAQTYTLDGKGKMQAGTFWARHIKGGAVILELIVTGPVGGQGFVIDEYVAGYVALGTTGGDRAICPPDDKENAICYETSHPTEYDHGRAVARLLINGSGLCTGWLASASDHFITNEHCISSASDALNTDYEFMAEAPTCSSGNCQLCWPGTVFSGATFIQDNANLDYCLVQINSGNPASIYGFLEIDNRVAVVGEQIYIPQHPGGRAKEFAIFSSHASDTGGVPRVNSITSPPCSGVGYNDVGYFADTEGGSSGSPVLATASHKVIALHHCANCPNRGVPIHLIHPEISDFLTPAPAGVVALDRGAYACSDIVGIELRDGDLQSNGTQTVVLTTTGGDSETVTLNETGPGSAIFEGLMATGAGAVSTEDGTLQVTHADTITVTYVDADDGQGGTGVVVTDAAVVDCQAPLISNVQTTSVQPHSATVAISADEPVQGTVHYGLSCGGLTSTTTGSGHANPATVQLTVLDDEATYFYTVDAEDEAGNASTDDNGGACYTFTTPEGPDLLLVDDDDNGPDVRSYFTAALDALGLGYDLWDTANSDNEPDAATLGQYTMVIWFTGDEYGGSAGPGSAGETALAGFLDAGGCLFISSQDYYWDRGLTSFMSNYLGVASAASDVSQTSVTGSGSVFGGYGPYALSYPFTNYSDTIQPDGTAEVAFVGNVSNTAVNKDSGTYRTTFWGFPFPAVPGSAERAALLAEVVDWCGALGPPPFGDWDGDGDVDLADYKIFNACLTGPDNGPVIPGCEVFDANTDDDVDLADFGEFQMSFTG